MILKGRMSYQDILVGDLMNRDRSRNISSVNQVSYNCAGFALETYSWYIPFEEENYQNFSDGSLDAIIAFLLNDFPDLRVIESPIECQADEYAIAFRLSADDFHFAKNVNGSWYHKLGESYIESFPISMYSNNLWKFGHNVYDSPNVYFAKKKSFLQEQFYLDIMNITGLSWVKSMIILKTFRPDIELYDVEYYRLSHEYIEDDEHDILKRHFERRAKRYLSEHPNIDLNVLLNLKLPSELGTYRKNIIEAPTW